MTFSTRFKNASTRSKQPKINLRPRNVVLREIEGWYTATPQIPKEYLSLHHEYLRSGSTLKFTRWLTLNATLSHKQISAYGTLVKPVDFKISCSYNDLLRLDDTKHYHSCLSDISFYGPQRLRYLEDPDICVCYVPDAAGKFEWRVLLRLVLVNRSYALVMHRVYGNGPTQTINERLSELLPVYSAIDIRNKVVNPTYLFSPSRILDKSKHRPIWTDHPLKTVDNHIGIAVHI